MSHAGHKIVKCSCGKVLYQCRCADPGKVVEVQINGCDECRTKVRVQVKPLSGVCNCMNPLDEMSSTEGDFHYSDCPKYREKTQRLDGSTGVDNRRGNWIQTYTGRRFYINDPSAEDVDLGDIAHALSNICRFTGHTREFYSVAEHCVRVSHMVQSRHALWGLLHDATEAYIGDVSRPLKYANGMEGYKHIERHIENAIMQHFNIAFTPMMDEDVKRADLHLLCVEARALLGIEDFDKAGWNYWVEPNPAIVLECWSPRRARYEFMYRFNELPVVITGRPVL